MPAVHIRWRTIGRRVALFYGITVALSLLSVAVVGCLQPAPAQWGARGCAPQGPVGPARSVPATPTREWVQIDEDPGRLHLIVNGRQAGAYCPKLGYFRSYDPARDVWGPPQAPPADLPREVLTIEPTRCCDPDDRGGGGGGGGGGDFEDQQMEPVVYDGGLMQSELSTGHAERIWIGTQRITLDRAIQAIEGVPDFRGKPRLTASGSEADRSRLREAAKTQGLLDSFLWADYAPEHWHLKDRDGKGAFKTDAAPTLYAQAKDGKVIGRMDAAQPGDLAKLRVQPPYDPAKDPDPRKQPPAPPAPGPAPLPTPVSIPALGWLGLAGLLLVLFLRNQQLPPR